MRIRAERRAGQLLSELQKGKGGQPQKNSSHADVSSFAQTKREAKISDTQAVRWQRLAQVPQDQFEERLQDHTKKVSPTGLIDDDKPVKAVPSRALWLWGRLRDFEEENIFAASPDEIIEEMLDTMKPDAERLIPILRDWLGESKFGGANGSGD